jgi:hypothetical protein
MESARRRSQQALAVTPGWDSRAVLAATQKITNDVLYFTVEVLGYSWRDDDRIPSKLTGGWVYDIASSNAPRHGTRVC